MIVIDVPAGFLITNLYIYALEFLPEIIAVSVGTTIVRQAKLLSGGDGHPFYVKLGRLPVVLS